MRSSAYLVSVLLVAAAAGLAWRISVAPTKAVVGPQRPALSPAIPVTGGVAAVKDVPVYLTGLGTVQAYNTVTIKVRVDGQLDKVAFVEGQDVKAGDVLAQIDPRPFQAALDQAKATKVRDEAQLANAELDLKRFVDLGTFATRQSVDTQRALIRQLQATIQLDQATIESAQVQLDYTTVKAPIAGRTGIRLVDQGNIVHAIDANGLVVVTQLQPISVIFSLPDDQLRAVVRQMAGGPLQTVALARDDPQALDHGTLSLVDNQIDQGTDTIRLKAQFPNTDHALWPGQFVTVRLLLRTLPHATTVPSTAVQRGPDGLYVYVIRPDSTVAMQPVTVAQMADRTAVITKGIEVGQSIVVSGQYRLQPGSRVRTAPAGRVLSEE
jgi:membrane fusion protein, multidrug efflux system